MSHFGSRSRPVSMNTIEAIIIGGGYGGVMAANRLAARGRRVHLVNDGPTFVNRIRLHQRAATGYRVTRPLDEMLFPEVGLSTQRAVRVSAGGVALAAALATAPQPWQGPMPCARPFPRSPPEHGSGWTAPA